MAAAASGEKQWRDFFRDPTLWWDVRSKNKSAINPGFRHAITGEVLCVSSCPQDLQGKLAFLESPPSEHKKFRARLRNPSSTHESGEGKSLSQLIEALKRCSKLCDLKGGRRIHRDAVEAGFHTNKFVAAVLITLYSKCQSMELAREVFEGMIFKDVVTWTSLILGYASNGESVVAMDLFARMNCEPDSVTYVAVLKACASLASEKDSERDFCLQKGIAFHKQIRDRGFESDIVVATTLVDMYSKCGCMNLAKVVFDKIDHHRKNVVTWNCLIMGYVDNGESLIALDLFHTSMNCRPSYVTYLAVLKACGSLASEKGGEIKQTYLEKGMIMHRQIRELGFESDVVVSNSLVDMYSKCGDMRRAREVFDRMAVSERNVYSWTSLILGYVENGESLVGLDLFNRMDCEADSFTYVAVLKACGSLAGIAVGQRIHGRVCRLGMESDRVLANSLIDFYGKCGNMSRAEGLFNDLHSPDIVSWNTLIVGWSSLGRSWRVFDLAKKMQEANVRLDGITFTCILVACNHMGLAEEGKLYFDSMLKYGISPDVEHYNCMVDMLGRANRLQDALTLVKAMPISADNVTWRTLLAACKKWKNLEVGKAAFDVLVCDSGQKSAAYVLMSDIYGSLSTVQ